MNNLCKNKSKKKHNNNEKTRVLSLLPARSSSGHHPSSHALQVNSSWTISLSLHVVQIQQQLTSPFLITCTKRAQTSRVKGVTDVLVTSQNTDQTISRGNVFFCAPDGLFIKQGRLLLHSAPREAVTSTVICRAVCISGPGNKADWGEAWAARREGAPSLRVTSA